MNLRRLLPLCALLAAGCGGGGTTSARRLTVHLDWPAAVGRVVPTASSSVRLQIVQGGNVVGDALLVRPATTATFANVPPGAMAVNATAYPGADGSGNAMATATTNATVAADGTANVDLTLASTIDHLTIAPNPIALALTGLFIRQIAVTAYDGNGAVVLTSPSDLHYATTNSLLFDVNATGLIVGLALGSATVTVTDDVSGKSATAPVVITL